MPPTPASISFDEFHFAQAMCVPVKRRSFFMYAGATAGATALLLAGCTKDEETTPDNGINLGSGDVGVLNYAYALEQLEAAFYAQVRISTVTGFSPADKAAFDQIAAHEAIHRDVLKRAITRDAPSSLLRDLTPDFSGIDFTVTHTGGSTTKLGVLEAAKAFEDLGVAAYNGAGALLKTAAYLEVAGKIVSVEARHAAYVRNLLLKLAPSSFLAFDTVDAKGLDAVMTPVEVVAQAQKFIKEKLDASSVGK